MKSRSALTLTLLVALLIASSLLYGCGNATPSTATVLFQPNGHTQTGISADTPVTFQVMVKAADTTPIPYAKVKIYGSFAVPRANARYQFYRYAADVTPNEAVDSGFEVQTDKAGVYSFSIIIPSLVSGLPNTFSDTIQGFSGGATIGEMTVSVQ